VEIGQLAFVAAVLATVEVFRRAMMLRLEPVLVRSTADRLDITAACAIGALAIYWLVERASATFFPVGGDIEAIVAQWIGELAAQGFEPDDPLLPATKVAPAANHHFAAVGLECKHWRDAGAIRRIFKQAFERVGLQVYNPHSFRHTLAVLGEKICRTPEEWKAYSQNFGHSSPMTTFNSYGPVAPHRQAEILNALVLAKPDRTAPPIQSIRLDDDQVRLILNQLARARNHSRVA
jgi:hypothetical protein